MTSLKLTITTVSQGGLFFPVPFKNWPVFLRSRSFVAMVPAFCSARPLPPPPSWIDSRYFVILKISHADWFFLFCYLNLAATVSESKSSFYSPGGGGGALFYTERLRLEVQTLTLLYTTFDGKGTPVVYFPHQERIRSCHIKLYPFHIPTEPLLPNFSFEDPLKYLDDSTVQDASVRDSQWKSLLIPK